MPNNMRIRESDVDVLARQNKTLDVETLCNKLEAYKREQDVVRVKREKRDALRTGRIVPEAAPNQCNATTAPTREDSSTRGHRSAPLASIAEPSAQKVNAEPASVYAAMNYVVKAQDGIATIVAETIVPRNRETTKRDSTSPVAEGGGYKPRTAGREVPLESRRTSGSLPSTSARSSGLLDARPRVPERSSSRPVVKKPQADRSRVDRVDAKEVDTSLYRPGDAAKRRSGLELFPKDSAMVTPAEFGRIPSIHPLQELHSSHYANSTLPILEQPRRNSLDRQRPKLAPNDRHDWCQSSQNGDSPRGLHFFPRSLRKADEAGRGRGNLLPESFFREAEAEKAQKGHLIADAVKIIKDQEKMQKRKSVLGLFKKL